MSIDLQECLAGLIRAGWEPVSLGHAGECRLRALRRRRIPVGALQAAEMAPDVSDHQSAEIA